YRRSPAFPRAATRRKRRKPPRRPPETRSSISLASFSNRIAFWGMEKHLKTVRLLASAANGPPHAKTSRTHGPPTTGRAPLPGVISALECPQSDSNRHCADFKDGSMGVRDQQRLMAEQVDIVCKATHLGRC